LKQVSIVPWFEDLYRTPVTIDISWNI